MANKTAMLYGPRSIWVRLRTLVVLRWIAVAGQAIAVCVGWLWFDLDLHLGLCILAIGASVVVNLCAASLYPRNKRLSETEIAGLLVFDILQLAFLVFLTGGLNNPFALLILTPVAIAAMALEPTKTVAVAILSVALAALLTIWYVPLRTTDGVILQQPNLFRMGFLLSIAIAALFIATYLGRVTAEMHTMAEALTATRTALAREQKLTDLGGVIASAAHELGTPLATIKLASSELYDDLKDHPELQEDARLIQEQANRCHEILTSMGQAGKSDLLVRTAPFAAVVAEAAEPHSTRGLTLHVELSNPEERQPIIERRPEIIHGLRNLVQNAVDFGRENVWIDIFWDDSTLGVRITDDGPGYAPDVIARIGDPFVHQRKPDYAPEYAGLGLGLFIAKTLLERSGAELSFANGLNFGDLDPGAGNRTGAIVVARWKKELFAHAEDSERAALGENRLIEG